MVTQQMVYSPKHLIIGLYLNTKVYLLTDIKKMGTFLDKSQGRSYQVVLVEPHQVVTFKIALITIITMATKHDPTLSFYVVMIMVPGHFNLNINRT